MADLTCDNCGTGNDSAEPTCLNCGFPLPRLTDVLPVAPTATDAGGGESGDPFAASDGGRAVIRLADGRQIELEPGERLFVGRSPDSPVAYLCGDNISWRHAEIFVNHDGVFVQDLGSTNGTYVDGHSIAPREPRKVAGSVLQFAHEPALTVTVTTRDSASDP